MGCLGLLKDNQNAMAKMDFYLGMVEEEDGQIKFFAADSTGRRISDGNLFYFDKSNGALTICHGINPDLDMELTSDRSLKIL